MSWECPVCATRNEPAELSCAACGAPNASAPPPPPQPKVVFGGAGAVTIPQARLPVLMSTPAFGAAGNISVSKIMEAPSGDLRRLTFGNAVGSPLAPTSSVGSENGKSPSDCGKAFGRTFTTPSRSNGPVLLGLESEEFQEKAVESAILERPGLVYTWGSGECEQLAVNPRNLNDENCRPTPIVIKKFNASIVEDVACGTMHCLALKDGTLYSWGCPDGGCLGRPVKGANEHNDVWKNLLPPSTEEAVHIAKVPAPVWGLSDEKVVKMTAGDCHCVALTDLGNAYAWGSFRDGVGPIGFPNFDNEAEPLEQQLVPRALPIEGVALDIASGDNHCVILTANHDQRSLYVFGSSEFGQLGFMPQPLEKRSLYLLPKRLTIDQLKFKRAKQKNESEVEYEDLQDESLSHTGKILHVFASSCCSFLQIESESRMRFFGFGRSVYGEVGAGVTAPEIVFPVELTLPPICPIVSIAGGDFSVLALSQDGSVWSWGKASLTGLGTSKNMCVTIPTLVTGLKTRAVHIASGSKTSYVCTRGGHLFAWGEGQSYQIGDGSDPADPVPRPFRLRPSLFDYNFVSKVAAGAQHVLALVVENAQRGDFFVAEKKPAPVRPLKRAHMDDTSSLVRDEPTPPQKRLRVEGSQPEEPTQAVSDPLEMGENETPSPVLKAVPRNESESEVSVDVSLSQVSPRSSVPPKPLPVACLAEPSQDEEVSSEDESMNSAGSSEHEEEVKPKAKAKARAKGKAKSKAAARAKAPADEKTTSMKAKADEKAASSKSRAAGAEKNKAKAGPEEKPAVTKLKAKDEEKPATRGRSKAGEATDVEEKDTKSANVKPKAKAKAKAASRRKAEKDHDEVSESEEKVKSKPKRRGKPTEPEPEEASSADDAETPAKPKAKAKAKSRAAEARAVSRRKPA